MKLDIDDVKKEYEVFVEDPKERLGYYVSEFSFNFLKLLQGAVEHLNSSLSEKLDEEYVKREPVLFTPDLTLPDLILDDSLDKSPDESVD